MRIGLNASGVLALVGVGVLGFLGWRAYRTASGAVAGVGQWFGERVSDVRQGAAEISQWVGNATSAPASGGDPTRAALYSDLGYEGIDLAGSKPLDGEWFSDEEARRYEYQTREMQRLLNRPQPVVGSNGAAFGIYPKP